MAMGWRSAAMAPQRSRGGTAGAGPSPLSVPVVRRRLDPAADLAEWVAAQDHLVAVLEERASGAVRQLDRLLSVPAQLDQASTLLPLGAGDGACGEQVARAQARAVHRQVSDLLGYRPVQVPRVRARHNGAVQLDLQWDVEGPWLLAQIVERVWLLRLARDAAVGELVERHDPVTHRRRERLPEERPQWLVLPGLDVAGGPVVHQQHAEDVVERALNRHRLAHLAGRADHEAGLELDVEAHARAELRPGALPARAPNRAAARHNRSRSPVIADREMPPVRQQRLRVRPEHPAEVHRVVER